MKYLLKNGTLVSGAGTEQKDILIEGEKIVKMQKVIYLKKRIWWEGFFVKYLLKNGTLVSGAGTEQKDILIEGEKIVKIEKWYIWKNGYDGRDFLWNIY